MELHEPVLVDAVVENLLPKHINKSTSLVNEDKVKVIDCTLGTAGHTLALCRAGATVLAIEADDKAFEIAKTRIEDEGHSQNVNLVNGNFFTLSKIATEKGFNQVSGILFDLGVNNLQLTSEHRGFSFENEDARLDMRIAKIGPTGADLLNILRKDQLVDLFSKVLKNQEAVELAKRIVFTRTKKPFKKVGDFLGVCKAFGVKRGLSQGTLPMLALRMAVNSELENLREALPQAFELLANGGKLAVITFHSGEDKLVDMFFKEKEESGQVILEKPIFPSADEVRKNMSARSAILRIITKINAKKTKK